MHKPTDRNDGYLYIRGGFGNEQHTFHSRDTAPRDGASMRNSNDHAIMVAQSPNANSNHWRAPRRIEKRSAVEVLNPLFEDLCNQLDEEQDEEQVLFVRNQFVQMLESIKRMKRGLPPDTERDEEFGT
jgi:hypothetical protein